MLTRRVCLQAMSENEEIAELLEENKAEVDQLSETYKRTPKSTQAHREFGPTSAMRPWLPLEMRTPTHRFQENGRIANFSCRVQEQETQSETTRSEGGVESGRS